MRETHLVKQAGVRYTVVLHGLASEETKAAETVLEIYNDHLGSRVLGEGGKVAAGARIAEGVATSVNVDEDGKIVALARAGGGNDIEEEAILRRLFLRRAARAVARRRQALGRVGSLASRPTDRSILSRVADGLVRRGRLRSLEALSRGVADSAPPVESGGLVQVALVAGVAEVDDGRGLVWVRAADEGGRRGKGELERRSEGGEGEEVKEHGGESGKAMGRQQGRKPESGTEFGWILCLSPLGGRERAAGILRGQHHAGAECFIRSTASKGEHERSDEPDDLSRPRSVMNARCVSGRLDHAASAVCTDSEQCAKGGVADFRLWAEPREWRRGERRSGSEEGKGSGDITEASSADPCCSTERSVSAN